MGKDEALKQALEALKIWEQMYPKSSASAYRAPAITAIKEALAQPEQEPVARADLQKKAQQIVESKFLWKRFIDGTPLANDIACWMADFARQYTAPPLPVQKPDCYGYAARLATSIWKQHYQKTAPQWQVLDDLIGVLTQIDNMAAGLISTPLPVQPEQEPVAWMLTDKNINSLQVDSIQRLIDRLKHAHHTDLCVRINGQDEWFQADWLKHMVRVTPPQRPWVGLTDDEISSCDPYEEVWDLFKIARKLEAKLKEKNTCQE